MSDQSENLRGVRVIFEFTVADDSGDIQKRCLETSVEEAMALKEEIAQAVDMLT